MLEEDFHTLIEFLEEYDDINCVNYSKSEMPGRAKYELFKYKSSLNDSVVLKYYPSTSRLQMQGKPLYLFNEILSLIGQKEDAAYAIVDEQIELCKIEITKDELNEELSSILGENLYNYLTITQKSFLSSSLVVSKMAVSGIEDYSYIVFPALKAYEGFCLKAMADAGLTIKSRQTLGEFFGRPDTTVDFSMKTKYTTTLERKKIVVFEKMYNFYFKSRHPYMHCTESDVTTVVCESYEKAKSSLDDVFKALISHYGEYAS